MRKRELTYVLREGITAVTDPILQYVPQVDFSEIGNLSPERVEEVRRKGSVVIRNVVDDAEATSWREWLQEYVTKNPGIEGNVETYSTLYALTRLVQASRRTINNSSSYTGLSLKFALAGTRTS